MTELTFQRRVAPWMLACFGAEISADRTERNHRFLEEALELVQSTGCTQSEAHQLVDYVFGRPAGEPAQESGGVSVTHAALCLAHGIDMHAAAEVELARIWTKVEAIRAKQAAKPRHSPLPVTGAPVSDWSWWAGEADSVEAEGLYDLHEAHTRDDLLEWLSGHVEPGERICIVEARTRDLRSDDEFQPFAATRNKAVLVFDGDGAAKEVEQ